MEIENQGSILTGNPLRCIYCGDQICRSSTRKGEHIIPKALGGTRTIKCVCNTCNNQFLSQLDKELVSKSHLSIVAPRHLTKKINNSWQIEHETNNLFLESQPNPVLSCQTLRPQLVLVNGELELRGDEQEFTAFGVEKAEKLFLQHLCGAFDRHMKLEKGKASPIILELKSSIPKGQSFPARIYAERPISEFRDRMHFKCRYVSVRDRDLLFKKMSKLKASQKFQENKIVLGSASAIIGLQFDASSMIRALTKIGVNLLVDVCDKTRVNCLTFPSTFRFIKDSSSTNPRRKINRCGFLAHDALAQLQCPSNSHRFRLIHYPIPELWIMYCQFFGGEINARVDFEGTSKEEWSTIDIWTPIKSTKWKTRHYRRIMDVTSRVCQFDDLNAIIPFLPPGKITGPGLRINIRPTM